LYHALELGYVEIAQLLDHGADMGARDKDGNTLLYVAVAKEQRDLIQVYLDRLNSSSVFSRMVSSTVQHARQTIRLSPTQSPETEINALKGS
jgi:ankyrin repeat protein